MEAVLMLLLTLNAGPDGSVQAPVRFEVSGPLAENWCLEVATEKGEPIGFAQKDGAEFVFMAPAMKANEKVTYTLKAAVNPPIRVLLNEAYPKIDVTVDGKPFTTYHYDRTVKKPYLYPVLLDGKHPLTRGYPMEDLPWEEGAKDHHHHRSWWVSYGDVNGADFWAESEDASQQRTVEILEVISGPVFGKIRALNSWNNKEGKSEVMEEREYIFYAGGGPNQLTDMKVTFRAENGDVFFGDTKEGGICSFRMNPKLDEQHGNGRMTNSEGQSTAKEAWGKPAKWNDYSGNLDGQNLGIAAMDHPTNLRHPTTWHIRDYGLYTANCFGLAHFTDKKENGEYTIEKGDSLTFNYRVYMHEGNTAEANIEAQYQAYVEPPKVSVK